MQGGINGSMDGRIFNKEYLNKEWVLGKLKLMFSSTHSNYYFGIIFLTDSDYTRKHGRRKGIILQ